MNREAVKKRLATIRAEVQELTQRRQGLLAALDQTNQALLTTAGGQQECEYWLQFVDDTEPEERDS